MEKLGYNPLVAVQIALAGNAADMIKHYDRAARKGEQLQGEIIMEMVSVDSSNIRAVGYDDAQNTLQVEFLNGSLFQYFDVPMNVFEGLLTAGSVDSCLHQTVKGVYRYSRV